MNIALIGELRSGKDTAADYLVSKYGYSKYAFGDGIKRIARELYPDKFADGRKPRALLQHIGQAARTIDKDVWVNDCFRRINEDSPKRIVITDVRQENEHGACADRGFAFIRIHCPESIRIERARASGDDFTAEDLRHETESTLKSLPAHYTISNYGSIDALHSQIDDLMSRLLPDPALYIRSI